MKDKVNSNDPFVEVNKVNVDAVIQILRDRLPRSANTYNMALMSKIVPTEVKLFIYMDDVSPNAWVLGTAKREDCGNDICISAPMNPTITEEIKEAFTLTQTLDWEKAYMFSLIDKPIATMLFEIGSLIKNNAVIILPQINFYMDRITALNLDVALPPDFINKSMNDESGVEFLVKTWKYSTPGTKEYIQRVTQFCPSAGIYETESGEPVSGIMLNFNGLMGMLYSSEKHRGKGLAQFLDSKSLLKQMALMDLVPASCCEVKNTPSKKFHEKIGMKRFNDCVDLIYNGPSW